MSGTSKTPSAEVLAWTTNDGLTPPPRGVRPRILGASALAMTGIWVGMLSVDTLCPEHRMWVQALATGALFSSILAIAGLVKQRSWAALFALLSATCGISIGIIDAIHDPTRGALIAVAFTALAAVLVMTVVRQYQSASWARATAKELVEVPEFDQTETADHSSRVDADARPATEDSTTV